MKNKLNTTEEKQMVNGWKTTAIVFMILTFLLSISTIVIIYEDEDTIEDWCEIVNDDADVINDLLDSLEYYNPEWAKVERIEQIDCEFQDE